MPDNTIRGRFAPSPSGRLHLGNILTFLLAWLDVRARGGTMVFRLEDLDPELSWEHYAELMADDLLWLGLDWDEGWCPGSQYCRQGTRTARYTAALDALTARGMVYDCYCSRAERLAASAPHPCAFLYAPMVRPSMNSELKNSRLATKKPTTVMPL